jgi:selenocysteine lyase/cysteine desulfurase
MRNIHEQEMKLTAILRDGLRRIDGVTLYCQDDLTDHIGVLLFNVEGLEAMDTGTMLDVDYGIACRTGLHCAPLVHEQLGTDKIHGAVRFGIGPFNTEEHVERAIGAVADIAASRKKAPTGKTPAGSASTPSADSGRAQTGRTAGSRARRDD